ncbi:MAG TPA: outer membrane beta-barrel protein [Bacteroidales bacterium]|nr:outer membrane beta-barrel protein [Bacteroidales bacterium]
MKKILIVAFCLFFVFHLNAQKFVGGVVGGMNVTQIEGDEVNGYKKAGFNLGGMVMLPLDRKQRFFITTELLFTQKGAYQSNFSGTVESFPYDDTLLIDPSFEERPNIYYKIRLDYVEVPVVIHYEDQNTGFAVGVGASWSRLVNYQETVFGHRLYSDLNSGRYKRNDWSFIIDVKIPVFKALKFNFRYQYSIVPMGAERTFYSGNNVAPFTRVPYNNVLTFRVLYTFNDKYVLNNSRSRTGERQGPKWVRESSLKK